MLSTNSKGKAMIISTFSSHLARIKSILEFSKILNRKVVFLGRSLDKYVTAGEKCGIVEFSKQAKIIKYRHQVQKFLKNCKNPEDYVFVVTGHQGEPKSVLARMIFQNYFKFKKEDIVIFSCQIIPGEANIRNREAMESELRKRKSEYLRIFTYLVTVLERSKRSDKYNRARIAVTITLRDSNCRKFLELAEEMGYKENKRCFLLKNGHRFKID